MQLRCEAPVHLLEQLAENILPGKDKPRKQNELNSDSAWIRLTPQSWKAYLSHMDVYL